MKIRRRIEITAFHRQTVVTYLDPTVSCSQEQPSQSNEPSSADVVLAQEEDLKPLAAQVDQLHANRKGD